MSEAGSATIVVRLCNISIIEGICGFVKPVANERLWLGHFGIEREDGMPVYRHAVLLRGAPGVSAESLEDMVDIAITECERFFPAFQFVLWGGKSASDALEAAMLDCAGEA